MPFLAAIGILAQTPGTPRDLATASLDELIARLPRVGCEGRFDESKNAYVLDPVALELRTRLARGDRMSDAQWERALLGTEAILLRSHWPADVPLAASMDVPRWLGTAEIRAHVSSPVDLRLHAGSTSRRDCGTYQSWMRQAEVWQEIGSLDPGSHRIEIEIEVDIGAPQGAFLSDVPRLPELPSGVAWRGRTQFPVEIVRSIDDVVAPRRGPVLEEKLRRCASLELRPGMVAGSLEGPVSLAFTAETRGFEELLETAFSFEVELWRESIMLTRESCRILPLFDWAPPCAGEEDLLWTGSVDLEEVPVKERMNPELLVGCEVRIRGTSKDLLRNWRARTRWEGEIRIPLSAIPIGSELLK